RRVKARARRSDLDTEPRRAVAPPGPETLSRRKLHPSHARQVLNSGPNRAVNKQQSRPAPHQNLPFYQQNWFLILLLVMALSCFALAAFVFLSLDFEISAATGSEGVEVSYGTVLKLMHEKTKFRLHSHDVPYGSGSGQQSVTGFPLVDDSNSYWIVKPELGSSAKQGDTIGSGAIIRLQHMRTRRWLHSHLHLSPISGNLEVSCFGEDAVSDAGTGKAWKQDQRIRLQHVDTGGYLHSHDKKYSRTAGGQQEVCSVREKRADNVWMAAEGVYIPVNGSK
ncbi:hypothetical protein RJ639_030497, partial [Escallonia herrerae]